MKEIFLSSLTRSTWRTHKILRNSRVVWKNVTSSILLQVDAIDSESWLLLVILMWSKIEKWTWVFFLSDISRACLTFFNIYSFIYLFIYLFIYSFISFPIYSKIAPANTSHLSSYKYNEIIINLLRKGLSQWIYVIQVVVIYINKT